MPVETKIPMNNLITALSYSLDLVNPLVADHHRMVTCIAYAIGEQMGLSKEQLLELSLASKLHDVGAFSLKERLDLMKYEILNPHKHSELGYRLLDSFEPFSHVAEAVRFHHVNWSDRDSYVFEGRKAPIYSHIIHLADRVAVLADTQEDILARAKDIKVKIKKYTGKWYSPEVTDAFMETAKKESFWFDVVSPVIGNNSMLEKLPPMDFENDLFHDTAKFFARIIDFRSPFTATHTSGVAAGAEALGRLAGLGKRECDVLKIGGYFHDCGKLAVPPELLDKPKKLEKTEIYIIRKHTYCSYHIINFIGVPEIIDTGAAYHHEKLNGTGYPFRLKADQLNRKSRLIAVADVFTAITEDRPYRDGMTDDAARKVLWGMAKNHALDKSIVDLLDKNYEEVNEIRKTAQREAAIDYGKIWENRERIA